MEFIMQWLEVLRICIIILQTLVDLVDRLATRELKDQEAAEKKDSKAQKA